MLEATGFGQFGCYGSPIQTPNLYSLAAGGIAYINMHTTALCSPSRSCMLTGRKHHSNNMAFISKICSVTVDVSGELIEDKETKTRMVMARQ